MDRLSQLMNLYSQSPNDAFLQFAIAKEHEKNGQEKEALNWYLQLRQAQPNYVGLYYHLGKLYERLQDLPKAVETYRAGIVVAKEVNDRHALGELNGARLQVDDEDDWA